MKNTTFSMVGAVGEDLKAGGGAGKGVTEYTQTLLRWRL